MFACVYERVGAATKPYSPHQNFATLCHICKENRPSCAIRRKTLAEMRANGKRNAEHRGNWHHANARMYELVLKYQNERIECNNDTYVTSE